MKIGIITLLGHFNYGNRLQNYALQEFLSQYSCDVKTIWFSGKDVFGYLPEISLRKRFFTKSNLKDSIKYILNWKGFRERDNKQKDTYGIECVREYNIKKFSDRYINIDYKYSMEGTLNNSSNYSKFKEQLNQEYDFFVVGSDQIWYPNLNYYYIKFLRFVEIKKRITYAASLGVTNIPSRKNIIEMLKKGYSEFEHISVREQAGADVIYKLTGIKPEVLVDPTMLISKKQWEDIAMKPEWYSNEKYILTYFLGEPSSIIKSIARKYNWKIYNMMDTNNFNLYTSRVEEFLYLIKNAKLVCTDSFHGTVFSIIFNTPFLVTNRKDHLGDMTSRIDTLLNLFNYNDRYLNDGKTTFDDEKILNMNFDKVDDILQREKQKSELYIKKALNLI